MAQFVRSVLIDSPVEAVFSFHERPDALKRLSPSFPPIQLISRTGNGLEPGSRIVLLVGLAQWTAVHTTYEKNRLFVDEQLQGPFLKWTHRHEFEPVGTQTRLTDRIEYEFPGGAAVRFLLGWAVRLGLSLMFAYRHRATRRFFSPQSSSSGER
jgi:ligand-binding SRPBCC domain-containing protein